MSTQESPAGAGLVTDVADLAAHVGKDLGHTEWREMTQERVNQFADVTDDHNFIHVDPERAKETVFGGTIAHGFLTLSMLAPISQQLLNVTGAKASINYGTDKDIAAREKLITNHIAFRKFDRSRITLVRGGDRGNGPETKLYRIPPGAVNPNP